MKADLPLLFSALTAVSASFNGEFHEKQKTGNILTFVPSRSRLGPTGNKPVRRQSNIQPDSSSANSNSHEYDNMPVGSTMNGLTRRRTSANQAERTPLLQSSRSQGTEFMQSNRVKSTPTTPIQNQPKQELKLQSTKDKVQYDQASQVNQEEPRSVLIEPVPEKREGEGSKSTTTGTGATETAKLQPNSLTKGSGGSYHSTMTGASERSSARLHHHILKETEQMNTIKVKIAEEGHTVDCEEMTGSGDTKNSLEFESQNINTEITFDKSIQSSKPSSSTHLDILEEFRDNFLKNPKNIALMNAASKVSLGQMLYDRQVLAKDRDLSVFSHKLKKYLTPLNQEESYTCSIFPIIRAMQYIMINNLNLKASSALSAWHISFYDLLEKVNSFLELIVETDEISLESESISLFLEYGVTQSSDWNTNIRLIRKYGIVPLSVYNSGANSSDPYFIIELLEVLIHRGALEIFQEKSKSKVSDLKRLREIKKKFLQEAFNILAIGYGQPVKSFKWEAQTVDKTHLKFNFDSPVEFYEKIIGEHFANQVTLCNYPGKLTDKLYSLTAPPRIKELPNRNFINLSVSDLAEYALKALLAGHHVIVTAYWDAIDFNNLALDTKRFDYESILGFNKYHSKDSAYQNRDWSAIHALLIVGVDLDESSNRPTSWQVENSWGSAGTWNMSQEWFEYFVYEIIVPHAIMDQKISDILSSAPIKKDFMASLRLFDEDD